MVNSEGWQMEVEKGPLVQFVRGDGCLGLLPTLKRENEVWIVVQFFESSNHKLIRPIVIARPPVSALTVKYTGRQYCYVLSMPLPMAVMSPYCQTGMYGEFEVVSLRSTLN